MKYKRKCRIHSLYINLKMPNRATLHDFILFVCISSLPQVLLAILTSRLDTHSIRCKLRCKFCLSYLTPKIGVSKVKEALHILMPGGISTNSYFAKRMASTVRTLLIMHCCTYREVHRCSLGVILFDGYPILPSTSTEHFRSYNTRWG